MQLIYKCERCCWGRVLYQGDAVTAPLGMELAELIAECEDTHVCVYDRETVWTTS